MTNFEPIKEKIWKAAQKSDKEKFDKQCTKLMEKACNDWWRIGWNICPNDVNDIIKMFNDLAKQSHKLWIKAMKNGDAPAEDVSPGEGFALCAKIIKESLKK